MSHDPMEERADALLEAAQPAAAPPAAPGAGPGARRPLMARTAPLWALLAVLGLVVLALGVLAYVVTVGNRTETNSTRLDDQAQQLAEAQRIRGVLAEALAVLAADNRRLAARNAQLIAALRAAGVEVPAPAGAAAGEPPGASSSSSRGSPRPHPRPRPSTQPRPSDSPSASPSPSRPPACLVRDPITGRCLVPRSGETETDQLEATVALRIETIPAAAGMYAHGRVRSPRLGIAHATVTPMGPPNARGVARFFASSRPSAPSSAHVTVDGGGTGYRSVGDGDTAYAAPGANGDGLHLELAAIPTHDRDRGRVMWTSDKGLATLADGAVVMGRWCAKYHLPVRWLTPAEVRSGLRGLADHWVCTQALGGSHWDVGAGFPVARWLDLVGHQVDRITHAAAPVPAPAHPVPMLAGAPAFQLAAGHYFGRPSSSSYCHSGYYSARDARGVTTLQQRLAALGYLHHRDVDGRYGAGTEAAVRAAQRRNRLRVDGRVGAYSWHALWRVGAIHAA